MALTKVQTEMAGTGAVLQVVNTSYGTQTSNSTSTPADTGLTLSITPKYATSKILVMANIGGLYKENNTRIVLTLLRNGSTLSGMEYYGAFTNTVTFNDAGSSSIDILDAPATTSTVTYKVQFYSGANIAAAFVQTAGSTSTLTLMEIAG